MNYVEIKKKVHENYHKVLVILHLSPLSLAGKCLIMFSSAVIVVLMLVLLIPYIWMGQLTKLAALDASRARAESFFRRHFVVNESENLPLLNSKGAAADANDISLLWIRFGKEDPNQEKYLTKEQRKMVKNLAKEKEDEKRDPDNAILLKKDDRLISNYVRIVRAKESCISCHNPQGVASEFKKEDNVGAIVIQRKAGETGKVVFLNQIMIFLAWIFGCTGAIIAFYIISQKVILSPVRQLRGLADNIAEGNLDLRSSINTKDEYQRLSEAFNHMLDNLQSWQEKLRQANKQLDEKIAELSERNIELFKANKLKSEFLANISHEFRTPLNSILGFAEILKEKPEIVHTEKGKRYSENIIIAGKNLLRMITDLLDLAKTEAGKMRIYSEPTNIVELCDSIGDAFYEMANRKNISLTVKTLDSIPIIMTDSGKVQQILGNFLSNAIKFTDENGSIELTAEIHDEKVVRISVRDSGCGISEHDQEKIFEKFRQLDGSITRESTGTGLGLAICRELAALMACTVGVESALGKGSTFYLEIPILETPKEETV